MTYLKWRALSQNRDTKGLFFRSMLVLYFIKVHVVGHARPSISWYRSLLANCWHGLFFGRISTPSTAAIYVFQTSGIWPGQGTGAGHTPSVSRTTMVALTACQQTKCAGICISKYIRQSVSYKGRPLVECRANNANVCLCHKRDFMPRQEFYSIPLDSMQDLQIRVLLTEANKFLPRDLWMCV